MDFKEVSEGRSVYYTASEEEMVRARVGFLAIGEQNLARRAVYSVGEDCNQETAEIVVAGNLALLNTVDTLKTLPSDVESSMIEIRRAASRTVFSGLAAINKGQAAKSTKRRAKSE